MSHTQYDAVKSIEVDSIAVDASKSTSNDISWSNINFIAGEKKILTDCWGQVPSGNVCAILGPSGAGKSSLLNVLAGRSATRKNVVVDGIVKIGSTVVNPVKNRKNIAYVMQDDALMPTTTPREALQFSAIMRLPSDTPAEKINGLVEKLLADLGLTVCADVYIGGALIKGISGGQRKRTSVGVEIITDPKVLFLDEPTTGLDSHSASNLVQLLKTVASNHSAVLCTIHQPSSETFSLFDIVIFMKAGRIFYQGPPTGINTYFAVRNHPVPQNYNPADFVMNLAQILSGDELDEVCAPIPDFAIEEKESSQRLEEEQLVFQVQSSFAKQVWSLACRENICTLRDIDSLIVRFAVTIVTNILFGCIFLGAGAKDNADPTNFTAHTGGLIMGMFSSMFAAAEPMSIAFPAERPIFLREVTTGTYTTTAYVLSKLMIEAYQNLILMLLQWVVLYFMIDFQGNYFQLVTCAFGLCMSTNSFALILGASLPGVREVVDASSILFTPQMLFAGVFIAIRQVPVFLRWSQYLCGLAYAMKLAYRIEFNADLDSCKDSPEAAEACNNLLASNGEDNDRYWVSILLLFVLFAGARLIAGFILDMKSRAFY